VLERAQKAFKAAVFHHFIQREKARRRLSGSYLPTPSLSAFRAQLFSSTVLSAEHSSLTRCWKFDYTHGGILRIPNSIQLPEEEFQDPLHANFVAFGVRIAHQKAPLIGCFYHQSQECFTEELIPNIINLNFPGKGKTNKYLVSFTFKQILFAQSSEENMDWSSSEHGGKLSPREVVFHPRAKSQRQEHAAACFILPGWIAVAAVEFYLLGSHSK
jgi:hypothetical protein